MLLNAAAVYNSIPKGADKAGQRSKHGCMTALLKRNPEGNETVWETRAFFGELI